MMSCALSRRSKHMAEGKLQRLQACRQQAGQGSEGHVPRQKMLVDQHAEEVAHRGDQRAQGSNLRHAVSCAEASQLPAAVAM